MGMINPSPGVVDFNSFRALQPLFDTAKELGVWIILRPGSFLNVDKFTCTALLNVFAV